jgi:hypothetical protein
MVELMEATAEGVRMKDSAMHQIFQKGPAREAQHDQVEPIDAGYAHKDHRGNRYGDEVAEVPDVPHQLARQCRCGLPHWIKPYPRIKSGVSGMRLPMAMRERQVGIIGH